MGLRLWIVVSTLLMLATNVLVSTPLLNGLTTGQISDLFPTRITPAGFTFSIWSVIYLAFLGLVVALVVKKTSLTRKSMIWLVLSCVFNIAWLLTWQYQLLTWAMIAMIGLLVSLIMRDRDMWLHRAMTPYYPRVRTVLHLYLGWISIATLVMVTVYAQYGLGILASIEYQAAIATLSIALIAHLIILCTTGYIAAAAVAIRAFWGISQGQGNTTLDTLCYISMAVLGLGVIIRVGQWRSHRRHIQKLNQTAQDSKTTL